MTERKYYQQPGKNDWSSRNYMAFYPQDMTMGMQNNTMFDEDGMGDLHHTINGNSSLENSPSKQVIDIKTRQKPGSRKQKGRRTLRQSLLKAYNNKTSNQFSMTGLKFSNINMKKRNKANIFSGERSLNYEAGVRIDRNIIPNGNFTLQNSPSAGYQINSARVNSSNRKQGDNVFALQRQIKDLRELLKERDQQMLEQKLSLNYNTMDHRVDDRNMLINENQQLRHQLNLLTNKTLQTDSQELTQLRRDNEKFKQNYDQVKVLLDQKDKQIQRNEDLLKQKDEIIKYLEGQLKRHNIDKDEELKRVMTGKFKNKVHYF